MATVDPADRRAIGPGLDAVFEMPSAAFPSAGETTPGSAPAPAPAPPPDPAKPGLDEVFGYPKEDKPGN